MKADTILEKAAHHMRDRATTYDKPKFIARVGREKCDAMFEVLKQEETGGLE